MDDWLYVCIKSDSNKSRNTKSKNLRIFGMLDHMLNGDC